jgi:hypothetical protein
VFYSLVETAKLHGLDPEAYLTHVLERIGSHSRELRRRPAALERR